MAQWRVPGLALAVVEDGQLVLARAYGVRELGKPDRVDADTLFDIGSNPRRSRPPRSARSWPQGS